jgi:hypothetical protein
MPDGHELKHRPMEHRPEPIDPIERARSERKAFARNPYPQGSTAWYAWRDGWLERKRWDEERDAERVRRLK